MDYKVQLDNRDLPDGRDLLEHLVILDLVGQLDRLETRAR